MSKVPLAEDPSAKEGNEGKKGFWNKGLVITLIISTIVLILMGVTIFLIEYYANQNLSSEKNAYLRVFSDCFSVSGIVGLGVYGLTYLSSKGAFDLLAYSVQLLFLNIFNQKYRKESFPKTYYDYKVLKDREKRKPLLGILLPSTLFLAVGIILLILYYAV